MPAAGAVAAGLDGSETERLCERGSVHTLTWKYESVLVQTWKYESVHTHTVYALTWESGGHTQGFNATPSYPQNQLTPL